MPVVCLLVGRLSRVWDWLWRLEGRSGLSPVNVPPVAYVQDGHFLFGVVHFVNDPVVSASDSPAWPSAELEASGWPGVFRKFSDGLLCSRIVTAWKIA